MFKTILRFISIIAICFSLSSCWSEETILQNIPDAENALFSADGRLFVTGGKNIYEISLINGTRFTKKALYAGDGNFCGMAQVGNYIYSVRNSGVVPFNRVFISAARLTVSPVFRDIYEVPGVTMGNGLEVDGSGRLYMADMGITGKILRLTISGSNPLSISSQSKWLSWGAVAPNGIKIAGSTLYFTDLGCVKKVEIKSNGTPGELKTIFSRITVLDDLVVYKGNLIVCDFTKGSLVYMTSSGRVIQETPRNTFFGPSSVIRGKGPMFSSDEFLVTEKGILGDLYSLVGNRLSLIYLD